METHPIKYFLLNKNELSYEVTIRGEEPASTVLELRKQINKLTLLIPSDEVLESGIEPAVDIVGLETSVNDYKAKVQLLKTKYDSSSYKRVETLGSHLHYRLKRFDKSDTNINTKLKKIVEDYRLAYAELEQLIKLRNTDSSTSNNTTTPEQPFEPSTSSDCDHFKISNLLKLKYDGTTSVHEFIQKVNDISTSRNIPPHKLLAFGTEIFTGNALHWFRGIKDTIKSWDELVKLLIADFSQFDYDYRLLSEIRNRTQGDSENIVIYISIMTQLFARLSQPPSENEKLQILLHNIKPCYASVIASASAITPINSIETLRTVCRNFEKVQCYTSQYREPPRATHETLAPDLAFVKPTTSTFSNNKNSHSHKNNNAIHSYQKFNYPTYNKSYTQQKYNSANYNKQTSQGVSAISNKSNDFCPRCRTAEHSLGQCRQYRFPICFKCGKKDVKYPDCPICHKGTNLNAKN